MAAMQQQLGLGTVFIGEKITHALPLLCVLVFLVFNIQTISYHSKSLKTWRVPISRKILPKNSKDVHINMYWLLILYWYLGPLFMAGVYRAVFSPWQVYHSRLTFWESFAVVCGCLLFTQTLLLLAIFYRESDPQV